MSAFSKVSVKKGFLPIQILTIQCFVPYCLSFSLDTRNKPIFSFITAIITVIILYFVRLLFFFRNNRNDRSDFIEERQRFYVPLISHSAKLVEHLLGEIRQVYSTKWWGFTKNGNNY
jgi:hypothetical protein